MKMQDLRERLLRQQPQPNSEIKYAISQIWPASEGGAKLKEDTPMAARVNEPAIKAPASEESGRVTGPLPGPPSGREALLAVTALFQFAEGFEDRIRELTKAVQPLEALSRATVKELAPLADFRTQIAQLAATLEPMKAFYEQLLHLATDFPPMQSLYEQVIRIPEEFQVQLLNLAESLAPAKSFRQRLEELAKAFEPVDALEAQFLELAEAFGQVVGEEAHQENGEVINRGGAPSSETGMEMSPSRAGSGNKSAWVMS